MNRFYYFILLVFIVLSCAKEPKIISIKSVNPIIGGYDTKVQIVLENFSSTGDCIVSFNGKEAQIKSLNKNLIEAIVPKGAGSGPVNVVINGNVYIGPDFEYLLTPIISTIAGNGNKNNKDGTALEAEFNAPNSIATDSLGNIYVVAQSKIRMITKAGMVTTIYDNNVFPYFSVSGICIDEDDNLFASGSRYIFKVNKNSTLTIIGNGDNTVSKYGYISFDCIFSDLTIQYIH
ncbi:MAG: hypothetical protein HC831_22725 [Chloroflexia bacterium]|nr:hypothetical protein [Chloroflexia bacterium]